MVGFSHKRTQTGKNKPKKQAITVHSDHQVQAKTRIKQWVMLHPKLFLWGKSQRARTKACKAPLQCVGSGCLGLGGITERLAATSIKLKCLLSANERYSTVNTKTQITNPRGVPYVVNGNFPLSMLRHGNCEAQMMYTINEMGQKDGPQVLCIRNPSGNTSSLRPELTVGQERWVGCCDIGRFTGDMD